MLQNLWLVTVGAHHSVACVAGVKRGRGRGNLGARERVGLSRAPHALARPTRSRAPKFPLPTPATQANHSVVTEGEGFKGFSDVVFVDFWCSFAGIVNLC